MSQTQAQAEQCAPLSVLTLRHFASAANPLTSLREREQAISHKPSGLWLTDWSEDSWPLWCIGEDFRLESLELEYEVILNPSRILHLSSEAEIKAFSDKHGADLSYNYIPDGPKVLRAIHWRSVAKLYDGILIAPYFHHLRTYIDTLWYDSWDCASGCVWNPRAIESFKLTARRSRDEILALAS